MTLGARVSPQEEKSVASKISLLSPFFQATSPGNAAGYTSEMARGSILRHVDTDKQCTEIKNRPSFRRFYSLC